MTSAQDTSRQREAGWHWILKNAVRPHEPPEKGKPQSPRKKQREYKNPLRPGLGMARHSITGVTNEDTTQNVQRHYQIAPALLPTDQVETNIPSTYPENSREQFHSRYDSSQPIPPLTQEVFSLAGDSDQMHASETKNHEEGSSFKPFTHSLPSFFPAPSQSASQSTGKATQRQPYNDRQGSPIKQAVLWKAPNLSSHLKTAPATERENNEQGIKEQPQLLTLIRHDNATLEKENITLARENAKLNESLRKETDGFRKKIQSLSEQLKTMTDLRDSLTKDFAEIERNQQQTIKSLRADVVGLRSDNDELRKYIAQRGAERQQSLQNEQYYIQQFQELKSIIEMWIAKQSKSSATKELSQSNEIELLKFLTSHGKSGKMSAEFLKTKPQLCQKLYANIRSRIQLLRHIMAVFLIDQIFEPFATGMPSSLSQALGSLLDSHSLLLKSNVN
jgi:hypothetical protein